jgi:aminopeptidase N
MTRFSDYALKVGLVALATIVTLTFSPQFLHAAKSETNSAGSSSLELGDPEQAFILLDKPSSRLDFPLQTPAAGKRDRATPLGRDDRPMDVTRYEISLQVSDVVDSLYGLVKMHLTALAPLDQIDLDLFSEGIQVEETAVEGNSANFTHSNETLTVPLPTTLAVGDSTTISVRYRGKPISFGLMGFELAQFNRGTFLGKPVIQTLSEPKSARSWWPCHDTPYDAATFSVHITCPDSLMVVVPGTDRSRIVETPLPGGLKRTDVEMSTPIPAYLFSLAISDYDFYSDTAQVTDYATGQPMQMPVEYYIAKPEIPGAVDWLGESKFAWGMTPELVEYFDSIFGPYPFAKQRYGMAMFKWGGGMEHATCSSMSQNYVTTALSAITGGPLWEWVVAHELAHQWFGDCVRVERWGEVWLNEGFASYCEVLWMEHRYSLEVGRKFRQLRFYDYIDSFNHPMVDPPVAELFGAVSYKKGAMVLHMLREVFEERFPGMGREKLLQTMREYLTDPSLRFSHVTSSDFQAHAETVYGGPLDWFFEPWLHRAEVCHLQTRWLPEGNDLLLTLNQDPGNFFRLPVPVRVYTAEGDSSDYWVWTEQAREDETLSVGAEVAAIKVDPNEDFLIYRDTAPVSSTPGGISFEVGRPNPYIVSSGLLFTVPAFAQREASMSVTLYDVAGRKLRVLRSGAVSPGPVTLSWDGRDRDGSPVSSGLYFLRIETDAGSKSQRVVLVR